VARPPLSPDELVNWRTQRRQAAARAADVLVDPTSYPIAVARLVHRARSLRLGLRSAPICDAANARGDTSEAASRRGAGSSPRRDVGGRAGDARSSWITASWSAQHRGGGRRQRARFSTPGASTKAVMLDRALSVRAPATPSPRPTSAAAAACCSASGATTSVPERDLRRAAEAYDGAERRAPPPRLGELGWPSPAR
jgi:hypothetical protein